MSKNLADELQRTARQALTSLQPMPMGEEAGGLPVQRLLAAIFRARYLVFATTLFGLLAGTFLAITTPNTYVSTGKFLFTGLGAESTALDPTRTVQTRPEAIAIGATHILNSDELLRQVVDRIGPARILQPYQPGGPADSGARALFFSIQRDWNFVPESERTPQGALMRLKHTLSTDLSRSGEALIARCVANDPVLAQEICETYMTLAVQLHIEKYDDTRVYEGAKRAHEEAVSRLAAARLALREFHERKASVDDFDQEKRRLQLDATEGAVAVGRLEDDVTIKGKLIEERRKLIDGPNAIPPEVTELQKPVHYEQSITRLWSELGDLYRQEARLKLDRRDPNDPDLRQKRSEIAAVNLVIEQMQKDEREAVPIAVKVPNPVYRENREELTKLESEMTTLGAQLVLAREQQEKRANRLRHLLALEPEYDALRRELGQADATEQATRINWESAERKRALGLGNFSSLRQIEPATLPLIKEGPNRSKLLFGGLAVGLFLGLGIVLLRALPDTVVRSRDDLEKIEGLAVIGVMPRLDRQNLGRHVALREQGW